MTKLTEAEEALVLRKHFEEPRKLIEALHPLDGRWSHTMGADWLFRGHWCSTHELVPSLYRKGKIEKFLTGMDTWDDFERQSSEHVEGMETELLRRVFHEFDRAGLAIPEVQAVRNKLGHGMAYLPEELISFVALAQHYGVPTRLLDWSTQGKVAAYFAAADVIDKKTFDGNIEIIAIHRQSAALAKIYSQQDLFRVVHAPRASNANLHAQSGVFTVSPGMYPKTPLDKVILEQLVGTQPVPVVQRLTLPQSLAGQLLSLLNVEGVSGATMFPGYDGAVKHLKEEKFYVKPYSVGRFVPPTTDK